MKKAVTILITFMLLISSVSAAAKTITPSVCDFGVALCYDGDAYSVDYILDVPTDAEVLSVSLNIENCFYDWNYVKSEARLYISLASANVIPETDSIATVRMQATLPYLTPYSVTINGSARNNDYFYHKSVTLDSVEPGFDTPGSYGGKICSGCGAVLEEGKELSPTGPVVTAVLDSGKALTVSGGVSDNEIAKGRVYLAIYDAENKMLGVKDITDLNQSDFITSIPNVGGAQNVKLLRWAFNSLTPMYDAVIISVKGE